MDDLVGLKENVLLGHLIPAGTGFRPYNSLRVKHLAEPPPEEAPDESEMLAEAAEIAEALGAKPDEPLTTLSVEMGDMLIGGGGPASSKSASSETMSG